MSIQYARSVKYTEDGFALLSTVLVAALVLGLAGWGILNMTSNSEKSAYGENIANQARTAALMGVQAITAYAQSEYQRTNPASLSNLSSINNNTGVDQSFTQPTNANIQAVVTVNTFGTNLTNQFIKVLSTGRSGSAMQTAQAYLTAILGTFNTSKANYVLGSGSTVNGDREGTVTIESTAATLSTSGIHYHGNRPNYHQINSLPPINPEGLQPYSTIQLLNNGANPEVYIPSTAVSFYSSTLLNGVELSSGSSYSCLISNCPEAIKNEFGYNSGVNTSLGTWTINSPINAFIYSDGNVSVGRAPAAGIESSFTSQLTVAAEGSITTNATVTLYPFASTTTTNYCAQHTRLPICDPQTTNPTTPYTNIQGLIYVSTGNNTLTSKGNNFYGVVATSSSLNLNGGGSDSYYGTIIAENGTASGGTSGTTTINGATSNTTSSLNSVTLGAYQITPVSIKWMS
jgi:hypothetical protein